MATAPPSTNLGMILASRCDTLHGRFVADLSDGGARWSYRDLDSAADRVAAGLRAKGHAVGDRIAILAENSAPCLLSYLGIMRAGLVAVPINIRLPKAAIAEILADCAAKLLLVDSSHTALAPMKVEHVVLDGVGAQSLSSLTREPGAELFEPFEPDEATLAEILYTSGSSGVPKGVMLTHQGQLQALYAHVRLSSAMHECALVAAPLYHMNGLFSASVALLQGMNLVLMPRFAPRAWLRAVDRHRCTRLGGVPSMFVMALREQDLIEKLDFSHVESVLIGSAPLTLSLLEAVQRLFPNARVTNGYGTTEAGPSIFGEHPDGRERPPLAVGYPMRSAECRLVQRGPADEGALEVRTPALFTGYLNRPGDTAERLQDGWYRTGDLFRRDPAGFYYFLGRCDDMFVCGGENIYPAAVEMLLGRHPDVLQVAVVPLADEVKGEVPVAFVVPREGRSADPKALRAFALEQGPRFSHPRAVFIVDRLPVGGTHKVDKQALAVLAGKLQR